MLYVKIFEFLHHIETEYQALCEDTGLNIAEIHVLRALFEQDGQKPSEIALKVGRAATSFTPILDRLEGKGFIRREPDKKDRRAIRIYLTTIGEALRQNIIQYAEEADEQLQAEMSNFLPIEDEFMERFKDPVRETIRERVVQGIQNTSAQDASNDDSWTEPDVFLDDIVGYPTTQYPASS